MNHLRNFFQGFSSALCSWTNPRDYIVPKDGFAQDRVNLQTDFKIVAYNLNSVVNRVNKAYDLAHKKLKD